MATKKKLQKRANIVVVRTYSAGVHIGELVSQKGPEVVLRNAVRLWRWYEANTLHEVATRGVGKQSRISEPVSEITLTGAIEIIPTTDASRVTFGSRWP